MWQLIKSEFQYNITILIYMVLIFIPYTVFALFDFQIITGPAWEVDYWGGIIVLVLYLLFYVQWVIRIKEQRNRQFNLLPVSLQQTAAARLLLFVLPITIIFFYLAVVHLLLLSVWHQETRSIIGQVGAAFISFSIFIILHDMWFTFINKNEIIKILFMVITAIAVAASAVMVFLFVRPALYDFAGKNIGATSPYIWGFVIAYLTKYSFVKRKSYLS